MGQKDYEMRKDLRTSVAFPTSAVHSFGSLLAIDILIVAHH